MDLCHFSEPNKTHQSAQIQIKHTKVHNLSVVGIIHLLKKMTNVNSQKMNKNMLIINHRSRSQQRQGIRAYTPDWQM